MRGRGSSVTERSEGVGVAPSDVGGESTGSTSVESSLGLELRFKVSRFESVPESPY